MSDTENSSDQPMFDWSTGSNTSSTGSFVPGPTVFSWDTLQGPVTTIPEEIPWRTAILQPILYLDYRQMPEGENLPRNNTAFRVHLMGGIEIGGRVQDGVIISIEVADADLYAPGNHSGNQWFHNKVAGEDFSPAQLEIQFMNYPPESFPATYTVAFTIMTTMTLGRLISAAMANQMHKFVFLPRHRVNQPIAWEGTTDFFLQFWALLVRRGEVSYQDAEGHPLTDTIGWFYRPNAPPILTQVPVPVVNGQ
ncbi:hypothetical protein NEOLEDRAFT_1246313 [Neolentinus lepideus HHB14362 ss-1]|uniref:Uncharacterized protein n=1 Tax=Neolentinus lepideus HHB14362 ss-1 TaxID=1314782 RepID=A0A165MS83_9AGAM|nr:hypothetical protein NEOLEDRAFT_1246313 [Neolentinus lepideus HHB14362 ss-1]